MRDAWVIDVEFLKRSDGEGSIASWFGHDPARRQYISLLLREHPVTDTCKREICWRVKREIERSSCSCVPRIPSDRGFEVHKIALLIQEVPTVKDCQRSMLVGRL